MPLMSTKITLVELAHVARRSIEPGMPHHGATAASEGTCLHATLIFVALMRRFSAGMGSVTVRGGHGGALDVSGVWRGHYWAEVIWEGAPFVVDITADQFGYEPVVVMPLLQSRSRYRPGPQKPVDEAFREVAEEFGCLDLVLESPE